MKFIEELRGTHTKTKKIFVFGTGPSLDDYPTDFFKDEICIGANWAFAAFLDIGDGLEKFEHRIFYSVNSHVGAPNFFKKQIPDFLKNCFFISHLKSHREGYTYWEDFNEDPYWMEDGVDVGYINASLAQFEQLAKCIMTTKDKCYYICRGTTLHWAIEAAAVLGAKKIYIIGGEAKLHHNKGHAQNRGLAKFKPKKPGYDYSVPRVYAPQFLEGHRWLAQAFKPYGVEIVQYYYETGEVKLA